MKVQDPNKPKLNVHGPKWTKVENIRKYKDQSKPSQKCKDQSSI